MEEAYPGITMPVQAILQAWPETASVFLKHRLSCPGCYMEAFDSLETALNRYSVPVEAFLDELREAIDRQPGSMIQKGKSA